MDYKASIVEVTRLKIQRSLDQHLTWKTHVNFIAPKISKSFGLLYKAKYYLPSKSLLTLYYVLI